MDVYSTPAGSGQKTSYRYRVGWRRTRLNRVPHQSILLAGESFPDEARGTENGWGIQGQPLSRTLFPQCRAGSGREVCEVYWRVRGSGERVSEKTQGVPRAGGHRTAGRGCLSENCGENRRRAGVYERSAGYLHDRELAALRGLNGFFALSRDRDLHASAGAFGGSDDGRTHPKQYDRARPHASAVHGGRFAARRETCGGNGDVAARRG